jgi:hypothetical protein
LVFHFKAENDFIPYELDECFNDQAYTCERLGGNKVKVTATKDESMLRGRMGKVNNPWTQLALDKIDLFEVCPADVEAAQPDETSVEIF